MKVEMIPIEELEAGEVQMRTWISEEDLEKCKDLAESGLAEGRIVVLDQPIPYKGKRFRGYLYVYGDKILTGEPSNTWFLKRG